MKYNQFQVIENLWKIICSENGASQFFEPDPDKQLKQTLMYNEIHRSTDAIWKFWKAVLEKGN